MKAFELKTDDLVNPLGIDDTCPHFYWKDKDGIKQSAYQIVCLRNGKEIWNSGKVVSDRMTHIPYEGAPLHSRDHVEWSVTVFDENDEASSPVSAYFEEGLLNQSDWKAEWISGNYRPEKNTHYPVDYFQKKFSARHPVKARIYASARGIYSIVINGERIEEYVLAPGITDYRKRIQVQTYDVTNLIQRENTLLVELADGWYRGSCAAYGVMNVYGRQTSFILQLELTYEDGSVETIVSDESWKWSDDGPLRKADLKDGESFDAGKVPSFSGSAQVVKKPEALLVSSNNVPVQKHECFKPKMLISKTGKKVLDFGQNIAGWISFDLDMKKGQRLTLTMGEILDENGDVTLDNIQETMPVKGWNQIDLIKKLLGKTVKGPLKKTPEQNVVYIGKEGMNHYCTSFAIFGFRYAQVETDVPVKADDFQSIAIYSSMEETGDYTCSNELVNQLVRNTRWSMKSNFLDIPTDCPTRERLGWTGDAQIFFNTGSYLMNTASFFRKWLRDMEDAQYKNGCLPAVLPYEGAEIMYKSTGTSVGWADAVYLIPYRYYLKYGDLSVLKECWPMIQKYCEYLLKHTGLTDKKAAKANPYNKYTYEKGIHLGEWLEPEEFRDQVYGASAKHPEECTAYFHYSMKIIGEIASLLGEKEYAEKLKEYEEGSKKAYNWLFVQKGLLDTDRQAKLVRPIALDLLDGKEKSWAVERLVKAVENYQYCVGTGFLSTPFILKVLSDNGHADTAYKMLENEKKPGWLSEVKAGATTIWENWEGDVSHNHYSPGSVCEWLFSESAGIHVQGENNFMIAPVIDESMNEVSAYYNSLYGKVSSAWKQTEDHYEFDVSIPSNTTAEIHLPDGTKQEVTAGTYHYETRK